MIYLKCLLPLLGMLFVYTLRAQNSAPISFDDTRWQIDGEYSLETYQGKDCIWLKNGKATLPDVRFRNGVIEYDVAFSTKRGFFGAHFRAQDDLNFEEYYMRAHQSGNPDAMQYTPVFNGFSGWQLYHGEGHGVAHKWRFDEWMHVKLVVNEQQMEVYIDDMENPVLHAFDLKREVEAGYLAIYTFLAQPRFANFQYQLLNDPEIKNPDRELPPPAPGTVLEWEVSEAIAGVSLVDKTMLDSEKSVPRSWKTYDVEYTGTLNLAQRTAGDDSLNTVLARFEIDVDQASIQKMEFGYSDEARVYVNGQLVYGGQRRFRSRDYRYLGTIGYFDTLYLSLKPGRNVITFAVSEQMGGWGVRARLVD